jgi:hypothetical protein
MEKYRDSNGANSLELSRSDFDPGRRIVSNGNATSNGINSLKLELVSSMKVLKGPISYVYADRGNLLQDTF